MWNVFSTMLMSQTSMSRPIITACKLENRPQITLLMDT